MMPPPKKPKTGPISIEQFLSNEEMKNIHTKNMQPCPSSGISSYSPQQDMDIENGIESSEISEEEPSTALTILHGLVQKPKVDFNRHSQENGNLTPQSRSPSVNSEGGSDPENRNHFVLPNINNHSAINPLSSHLAHTNGFRTFQNAMSLSLQNGEKVLNNLANSTLINSATYSYPITNYQSYLPSYLYRNSMSGSPVMFSGMTNANEPHDLSTKIPRSGLDNVIKHKPYENSYSNNDQITLQRHYFLPYYLTNKQVTETSADDQQYLEAHKNIVNILKDRKNNATPTTFPSIARFEQDRSTYEKRQSHIHNNSRCCIQDEHFEDALSVLKQISTGSGCSVSMGKYYPENGLHINMSGESDKVIVKEEEHHQSCGLVSPALFRPVPGMMPGYTQAPSSTTIDLGDHKQLGFPHFDHLGVSSPDNRKMKLEGASSRLCQVCSDNASGFHYGVWSCEGCKAFFKRSIQGPVDYICPATNSCTIDKHRRKSCQACRLRKCYEVGMNKGSQRKDRKNSVAKATKRSRADSTETTVNSTSSSPIPATCSRRTNSAAIVEALTKADFPVLESYHNYSLPPTKTHLLTSLVKVTERELVQLINWAKSVPGYTDLSLSDQVHLIERCWMELLLFNCAFHSMKHDGKKVVFAPDFSLDRIDWHTIGMTDVLEQVAAVSEQLVLYGLHREEVLLLQAIVLVNAEVRRLSSFGRIFEIRQVILDALSDMGQKYHPENHHHVPSTLLLLSHIRQAGERCIAYFQSVKSEACVAFSELLTEMLDSHSGTKSAIAVD